MKDLRYLLAREELMLLRSGNHLYPKSFLIFK